jgi:PAS domain S-box-containing protein
MTRYRLVLASAGLGILFWFVEATIHAAVFGERSVINAIFAPDLHELWMRSLVVGLFIAFGAYAQLIVSRRKHEQRASEAALAELNQIFETVADGMRIVGKDFDVLRVNAAFETMSGVDRYDAIGKKCHEVFPGPACHTPDCPLTRALGGEAHIEYDVEKKRKGGESVPCILTATPFRRPSGDLIGIVQDFKDISKRTEAAKALRESEERSRSILQTVPSGLFTVDLDRRITSWNKAAEEMIGAKAEEVIGKHCLDVFDCDACKKGCAIFDDKVEKPLYGKECVLHVGGKDIIISKNADSLKDMQGKAVGGVESFVDITNHKRAEQERSEKERLRGVLETAGAVCHEFNQPLQSISGFSDLLMMGVAEGGDAHKYAEAIQKQVYRMGHLTRKLLDIKDQYATKPYLNSRIVDIHDSSKGGGKT